MKTITFKISITLKVGDKILVQEPTQHFSHDCYIVKDINNYLILESANGDKNDGKLYSWEPTNLEDYKITKIN